MIASITLRSNYFPIWRKVWFIDKKSVKITYFCSNTGVGAVPVILIVLQILVEMYLSGACKLMNSLINSINHAGITDTLIFN